MFINTYIWEKLLTVRLFWAGAGQRVAAQGGWSGDRTGAGACVVHVGALGTTEPTVRGSVHCPEPCQSVVLTTNHQPREREGTNTCWLGIGAGLLSLGWTGSPPSLYEWCRQTPFSSVWLVIPPHRQTPIAGRRRRLLKPWPPERGFRPPNYNVLFVNIDQVPCYAFLYRSRLPGLQ